MRQIVEGARHHASDRVAVEIPADRARRTRVGYWIYSPIMSVCVERKGIGGSTHKLFRFVRPPNIFVWTSRSLLSDRSLWKFYEWLGFKASRLGDILARAKLHPGGERTQIFRRVGGAK